MPAVLVHGVPDTPRLWDAVRSHLSRTDIVTPNLPGFDAPLPAGFEPTKESYAEWLIGEVEAVGEPVDIVGHDWGSLLVQRLVSVRPDLVRTWCVGDGPVDREYVWHDMAQLWQTPDVGEQIMEGFTPDAVVAGLADELGGAENAAEVASHIDDTMKSCILTLYRSAVNVGAEWGDAVDTITLPGLVLWAEDDAYVDVRFGHRLAARTGARLVTYADSGHWWPTTKPPRRPRNSKPSGPPSDAPPGLRYHRRLVGLHMSCHPVIRADLRGVEGAFARPIRRSTA